ncbi:MAG: zinc-ribbon domain-containing protein [Clostridiaceae bacterium]
MEEKFYCPDCKKELERISACGSVSYFCNNCNKLISRSKMLSKDDIKDVESK